MAESTRNLALPLIAASQAQKHVTHNEALTLLDALVQLSCLDKDLAAPPASPAEGDRYLVVAPAPTGAWAGLSGQVVRFADGVWTGSAPRPGWFAYVVDEADLYVFTGTAWTSFRASLTVLQNLSRLGVGTAADAVNRLAVKSEAALFSWDDATPGPGNMRITLNRKLSGNDAGFVFQTGYATRALFGTLADDDFVVKVSPDGASFSEGLRIKAGSGLATFPGLLAPAAKGAAFTGPAGAVSTDAANTRLVLHDGATAGGVAAASIPDLPGRNAVINGLFLVNQRAYAGGTALAAGAYGHDRWKAGAGGCTYSVAQTPAANTVTITAGTLVQAVDASNVHASAWWLTWTGTAQARIWQGSAAGAYAAGTPRVVGGVTVNALPIIGVSPGTTASIEFSGGTVSLVQFEAALPNAGPTRFERRHGEPQICARYYQRIGFNAGATLYDQYCASAQNLIFSYAIQPMRATPTIGATGISFSNGSSLIAYGTNTWFEVSGSASGAGRVYAQAAAGGAYFELSAEI